jgi:hypothetical protein
MKKAIPPAHSSARLLYCHDIDHGLYAADILAHPLSAQVDIARVPWTKWAAPHVGLLAIGALRSLNIPDLVVANLKTQEAPAGLLGASRPTQRLIKKPVSLPNNLG